MKAKEAKYLHCETNATANEKVVVVQTDRE